MSRPNPLKCSLPARAPSLETLKLYAQGAPGPRVLRKPVLPVVGPVTAQAMAPAGLPDWDDALSCGCGRTSFDASPYALEESAGEDKAHRDRQSSHVRVRPSAEIPFDAMRVLDHVGETQLQLTLDLFCLEAAMEGVAYDPSARAAEGTLRTRVQEIADLRDALNEVYLEASDPRAALLFTPGRPLAAYVRGLYVWAGSLTLALTTLGERLRVLTPDWVEFRRDVMSASAWYFDGLVPSIREDVARVGSSEMTAKVEELVWAASLVWQGIEKKFG